MRRCGRRLASGSRSTTTKASLSNWARQRVCSNYPMARRRKITSRTEDRPRKSVKIEAAQGRAAESDVTRTAVPDLGARSRAKVNPEVPKWNKVKEYSIVCPRLHARVI